MEDGESRCRKASAPSSILYLPSSFSFLFAAVFAPSGAEWTRGEPLPRPRRKSRGRPHPAPSGPIRGGVATRFSLELAGSAGYIAPATPHGLDCGRATLVRFDRFRKRR